MRSNVRHDPSATQLTSNPELPSSRCSTTAILVGGRRRGPSGATVLGVPRGEHVELELSGRTVRITSPDKVMFPERGETKLDLVQYYQSIEQPLMRAMGGRPVLMERYPNGVGGSSFFQKRVPEDAPDWLETPIVST